MGSCLSSVRRTTALREEVVDRVTLALGAWTDSAPVESPVSMNVHQPTRQGMCTHTFQSKKYTYYCYISKQLCISIFKSMYVLIFIGKI